MNRKTTFGLLLSALAVVAVGLPSMMGANLSLKQADTPDNYLRRVKAPSTTPAGPMRLVSQDGFFYEDFEKMTPGVLDSGWTTSPTPGHPSDNWSVATLGAGDKTVPGMSGYQYAYILGNRDTTDPYSQDAWLFSPAVNLPADTECKIEFFSYMAVGYGVNEILEVAVMDAADPNAVIEVLDYIEDGTNNWSYYTYKWIPEKEGEYYIGFHSLSPCMSNATLIDDVRVSCAPMSSFVGYEGVDMGDTDLVAGSFKGEYMIQNQGNADLEVNVVSASPEIKVVGMPLTISAHRFKEISIEFTPSKVGRYMGQFTLSTNDPSHPEVQLIVISNVKDVPVTGYHVEDFEAGGPKGWSMNTGAVNTDYKGGHNGPRSFYVRSFYSLNDDTEVGFKTHYYDMGPNPELSMWYKMTECDHMGVEYGPISPDYPILEIYITDDMAETWTPVYTMMPGTDTQYNPSADFQEIKIDLAQFADKRCRMKTVLHHAGNPLENDFILLIDDVAMGTQPDVDLKTSALYGKADVTTGKECVVNGTVTNYGSQESGVYTLELADADGKVYASSDCASLAPGASTQFTMNWTPETSGCIDLKVTAKSDNDPLKENNISNIFHASVTDDTNSYISVGTGQMYLSTEGPVYFCAKESLVQTLYYANEIGIDAGDINSVTFFSAFNAPYLSENFELYIAETDRKDFNNKEIMPEELFTKVFSGNLYMPEGEFEFVIPFEKPYSYNGGNLIIMTRKCSEEYLNTKQFIVHQGEQARSITSTAVVPGTLASSGYVNSLESNMYSHIGFNMYKAPAGSVTGTINDIDGNPIKDATISLDGTELYTSSNSKGIYNFPEIKIGDRTFSVEKYGYYPSNANPINVEEGKENILDITLTPYPRVSLKGTVTTTAGQPVSEAKVVLEGYGNYSAVTDENGNYEITGIIGDTGEAYNLRVEAAHFQTFWDHDYQILNSDLTYDVTLEADKQPAFNVKAVADGDNLNLSWEAPLTEFKHDNGIPTNYLGWSHGHARAALFSTYRQKIRVKQISFYLSDVNGPHSNINLFIVELNEKGYPDPEKMHYLKQDVPFTDNTWNTLTLEEPVEMENFAVGISGNGYIGLGASDSDEDHPFEPMMHFWAGDDMYNPYDLMDFSIWAQIHPMLRIYGDYLGNPATDALHESLTVHRVKRPDTAYDVYRIEDVTNPADMKFIGSTEDLEFSDDMFKTLENEKKYQYAVVAKYGNTEAAPVLSNIVTKDPSAVNSIFSDDISFGPNPVNDILNVTHPELVSEIRFASIAGNIVATITNVASANDVSELPAGVYIITIVCNDGSTLSNKIIKK